MCIIMRVKLFSGKSLVLFSEFFRGWICSQIFEFLKYKILWKIAYFVLSSSKQINGRTVGETQRTKQTVDLR